MRVQAAELPMLEAFRHRTSAISESALVYGYRGATVRRHQAAIEPCACGDDIVAISRADADVFLAVRAHNQSTVHQQWRARRERA